MGSRAGAALRRQLSPDSDEAHARGFGAPVEIEELTDPTLEGRCDFQLVRYLHAERDLERHLFTHMDGAVRFYERGSYEERLSLRWPSSELGAPAGRRKVFRADGDISTAQWSDLVALWFRGNHLVLEALATLTSGAAARR